MKPTDKEYIEALAEQHLQYIKKEHPLDAEDSAAALWNYINGAKEILEHTNHAELVEAAKTLLNSLGFHNQHAQKLLHEIKKSETSKL